MVYIYNYCAFVEELLLFEIHFSSHRYDNATVAYCFIFLLGQVCSMLVYFESVVQ